MLTAYSTRTHKRVMERFHMLAADYCPYCRKAKEAMMEYFNVDTKEELKKYVKLYSVNNSTFDNKFRNVVPSDWRTIPAIISEDASGRYKFVGGYTDFMKHYM